MTGPRRPLGVGPEWMPRRRWRIGIRVHTDVTLGAAFLLAGVAAFVFPLVGPAERPPAWGRREDATRAGRALADIRTLVEWNRPW